MGKAVLIQRPQRTGFPADQRLHPRHRCRLRANGFGKKRLRLRHRLEEHPVKLFRVTIRNIKTFEFCRSSTTHNPFSSRKEVFFGLFGTDRGSRQRKCRHERMSRPAIPASNPQYSDTRSIMVFVIRSMTGELTDRSTGGACNLVQHTWKQRINDGKTIVFTANVD